MNNQEIAENIANVLGGTEGWWSSSSEQMIEEAALTLLEHGMEPDDVSSVVDHVIRAIRNEYGE